MLMLNYRRAKERGSQLPASDTVVIPDSDAESSHSGDDSASEASEGEQWGASVAANGTANGHSGKWWLGNSVHYTLFV